MKRRAFCASSLALASTTLLPFSRARAGSTPDLPAISRTGQPLVLKGAEVDELRASLRGPLLLRDSEGYEAARHIWNGAFDRHPAAIARCSGAADVVQAVQFAATHDLLVAVRGGGHSLPGHSVCEGGLMIDLATMQGVLVDPAARRARVQPGVHLGALDREAQAFGLIAPAGTVSHTGVAGLTLGGGFGRVARRYGLTIDSLLSADVVTAGGKVLHASEHDNADLFWALRGGGGNFGVVTAFEFALHSLGPTAIGGDLIYPLAQAREVLEFFAEYAVRAPDEIWMDPVLECDDKGERHLLLNLCHCGDARSAAKDIDAIRNFKRPLLDNVGARPYVTLQSEHDWQSPPGRGYYMSGGLMPSLPATLLEHAIESIKMPAATLAKISFTQHGGAIARVAPEATAFANRAAPFNVVVRAAWDKPEEAPAKTAWQKNTWGQFAQHSSGLYANLNLPDADPKVRGAYGPNLERLVALKTKYDPANLFHLNPNIAPGRKAGV